MDVCKGKQGRSWNPGRMPDLMERVRERCRVKHYSLRTEQAYLAWIWRFIRASGGRHPRDLGGVEVEGFLTRLATDGNVAPSTQNQALAALLFLYREVLGVDLPWMENVVRAKGPRRIPVVLSTEEVGRLLAMLDGQAWLMAALLLRHRHAADGMRAPSGEGCGFPTPGNRGAQWQGRQGSPGAVATAVA